MTQSYEEYLKHVAEHGDTFSTKKEDLMPIKSFLIGKNKNKILYKKSILLNYGSTEDDSIICIEDDTNNKQLTHDLNNKIFTAYVCGTSFLLDFNTDYYYNLIDFDKFNQYEYCQKNKKLTIALLNDNKTDIINKWTTDVNLL